MKLSIREQILAAVFAAVIAIFAQITIPLGLVPLTLQTFIVGVVASLLGSRVGTWSVLIYLLLGAIGLPVYAGGSSGIGALFGPTGGYLISFLVAAFVIGKFIEKTNSSFLSVVVANTIGTIIPLFIGTVWLKYAVAISFTQAFAQGFVPFILAGVIKTIAASIVVVILYKRVPRKFLPVLTDSIHE